MAPLIIAHHMIVIIINIIMCMFAHLFLIYKSKHRLTTPKYSTKWKKLETQSFMEPRNVVIVKWENNRGKL